MDYLGSPRVSLALRKTCADAALALANAVVHCEVTMTGTKEQQSDAKAHLNACKGELETACLMAAIEYHATS